MEKITLRELCEELKISRRTVQGYEKAGLVVPSDKTKRGYLLYDEKTQETVREILFYRQLGFQNKEIKWLLDASGSELKEKLEKQVKKLKDDKIEIDGLIEKAQAIIEKLSDR